MAVFGHSGSQAPQLMHSLVIVVAMAIERYHRVGEGFKSTPGPRAERMLGGAQKEGSTMRITILVSVVALALVASVRAEDNAEMTAAQQDLQSAKSHLQAAAHDYAGHRKSAIQAVDRALADVRQGLATVEQKEKKVEKKEEKAQKKVDQMKAKDQQLKQ
jgi:hypothetical protein